MNKIDNLDFYGGTTITYTRVGIDKMNGDFGEREEQLGIKPVNTSIIPMAFVGGKYALNQKLSVNAELTYGVAIFKMGVSYRLF